MIRREIVEILELNAKFRRGQIVRADAFHDQFVQQGVEIEKSVIVSIFPDGSGTFVGVVIDQDAEVYEFDIDLDLPEHSRWVKITEQFMSEVRSNSLKRGARLKRAAWRYSQSVLGAELREFRDRCRL